ncbi:MAG: HPr(Ser) kinase/phosphatase [Kiritimatiellia bacterium]
MKTLPQSREVFPTITVKQFMEHACGRFDLEFVGGKAGLENVIDEPVVHRPGLALSGFYGHFAARRIQLIGMAEYTYLQSLDSVKRARCFEDFLSRNVPCVVFACGNDPFPSLLAMAERRKTAVLKAGDLTRHFMMSAMILLEELTSPRCRVHATMVDVSGMGVLIEAKPGLGKSETALGLIKRGHALVADDLTCLRRQGIDHLLACATETSRDFMEIRGIGMLNVRQVFGVGSVRRDKQVDLVLTLMWQEEIEGTLDRSGIEVLTREFLGVRIPQRIIPVAPGRSLVNMAETAAQEQKLRLSGYVAVDDFGKRVTDLRTKGVIQ